MRRSSLLIAYKEDLEDDDDDDEAHFTMQMSSKGFFTRSLFESKSNVS